jgi:hypothetical protein
MTPADHQSALILDAKRSTSGPIDFGYFLADRADPVKEEGALWNAPIPLSRNPQRDEFDNSFELTYGDYFTAVRRFLEDRQFQVLAAAIQTVGKKPCLLEDIEAISLFLVKHGQFYHPCKLGVRVKQKFYTFVVNVAISSFGKNAIEREFNLLNRLVTIHSEQYLPQVYGYASVSMPNGFDVKLFIGEWFEDFHEFHLSRDPVSDRNRIRVWREDGTTCYLMDAETQSLYRQIATILTVYYDPETFDQIHPWHHAAGDFVVRCTGDALQVRLITVRNYGALLDNSDRDETTLLEAMLYFMANLSIRTRLDRFDGVGEVAWSGITAVRGTVQGFVDGLKSKNPPWDHRFRQFMKSVSMLDFIEVCEAIADSYHPHAPEIPVIRSHLQQHAAEVYEAMKVFLK